MLCVPPTTDSRDAIRAVKWHPKDSNMLAIAAEDRIYVIDLMNTIALHGQPLPHSDLHHIGQLFTVDNVSVSDLAMELNYLTRNTSSLLSHLTSTSSIIHLRPYRKTPL